MTILEMLDTGLFDQTLPTPVLEEASDHLDQVLMSLQECEGAQIKAIVRKYELLDALILTELNHRHGVDGMTLLLS